MARKGYKTASFMLPNGTRKYVYAKTKEELEQKVFELKLQMRMGVDLSDDTTVGELIQMWYKAEIEGQACESVDYKIRLMANTYILPKLSAYRIKDVLPVQISQILDSAGTLNRSYAQTIKRILRDSFAMAEENGLIYKSPFLQRFKVSGEKKTTKRALTPEEERRLLDGLSRDQTYYGRLAYLFCWLALSAGMRRGEILGLMWDCVDLDNAVIHVRRNLVLSGWADGELHDYLKTEAGTRDLAIPYDLCEYLRSVKARANSMFVFCRQDGRCLSGGVWQQVWLRTRKALPDTQFTAHELRHTFCTRCVESGMVLPDVQYLMGHADPAITLAFYTHFCAESRLGEAQDRVRSVRKRTTSVPHNDDKTVVQGTKRA